MNFQFALIEPAFMESKKKNSLTQTLCKVQTVSFSIFRWKICKRNFQAVFQYIIQLNKPHFCSRQKTLLSRLLFHFHCISKCQQINVDSEWVLIEIPG